MKINELDSDSGFVRAGSFEGLGKGRGICNIGMYVGTFRDVGDHIRMCNDIGVCRDKQELGGNAFFMEHQVVKNMEKDTGWVFSGDPKPLGLKVYLWDGVEDWAWNFGV